VLRRSVELATMNGHVPPAFIVFAGCMLTRGY
jgi:hypothetical protein